MATLVIYYSEMVTFEDWAIKPSTQDNREPESAINLAQLEWQVPDKKMDLYSLLISLGQSSIICFPSVFSRKSRKRIIVIL